LPNIATINGIDITTLASFGGVAFADGQTLDGQNVALVSDAHTFISSQTASASATLDFTSGIDSTYDVYEFHFINMHPATSSNFTFQVNAVGQSGFNEVITSTFFRAYHLESGSSAGLGYRTSFDQAQGTAYQPISEGVYTFSDSSVSGVLTLYAPSSTTYVTHFSSRLNMMAGSPVTVDMFCSGYINVTSAIDEISFKFASGNIDAGEVRMYGVAIS
jgi:hypothetical protein